MYRRLLQLANFDEDGAAADRRKWHACSEVNECTILDWRHRSIKGGIAVPVVNLARLLTVQAGTANPDAFLQNAFYALPHPELAAQ